jgi:hypothetical protein
VGKRVGSAPAKRVVPRGIILISSATNSPAKSRICERAPGIKSLLVLFFRKEQESSFSEEKEAKRL